MKMKKKEIIIIVVILAGAIGVLVSREIKNRELEAKFNAQLQAQQTATEAAASETASTEEFSSEALSEAQISEALSEAENSTESETLIDMGSVWITANGEDLGTFPLNVDQVIKIHETNVLTIKDGKAWMSEASCPDHICEQFAPIDFRGGMIVCLPNEVLVEGIPPQDSTEAVVDGIAQ